MSEPRWLSAMVVLAMHFDQTKAHGGSLGLRDRGFLESALDRPRNCQDHESVSGLRGLAALHGFGIATHHPFVDGNKRVAFLAICLFLGLHVLRIDALEGGGWSPSSWLRDHTVPH